MPETEQTERRPTVLQKSIGRLGGSRLAGWIANFPPIAWATRTLARILVRRRISRIAVQEPPIEKAVAVGLEATLQQIVRDVVEALDYAGAMVATYDQGDTLPVRAFYIHPGIATAEQIQTWEEEVSKVTERPVSITNPEIARVFVYRNEYEENLSVRAFRANGPVISDHLYDLFTPIAPLASRPMIDGIQEAIGIQQVIAVPFFLETVIDGRSEREIVGNLFVAKRSQISEQDERILSAFGRQAAAAIQSERRRLQIQVAQEIVFEMQSSLRDEDEVLRRIAEGVVSDLGYVGAMVATYEPDDSMSVRAFYVEPNLANPDKIQGWVEEVSKYTDRPLSIADPEVAKVFVHQEAYQGNLSVRAFVAGGPVASDELYDLLTPVTPPVSRPVIKAIQQALGIQTVIAVPFFFPSLVGGQPSQEIVGNLFAATRSKTFSGGEIELLKAFGQQAAAGIRNAQLYRKAEERRQVAQVFGKMAFSAAAFVHTLRNHIGAFRTHLGLLQALPADQRDEALAMSARIDSRLSESADILDHLHEPWRENPDVPTDVNRCLGLAMERVIQDERTLAIKEGIVVHALLDEELPPISTSPDVLTEAFRVLIKNGVEAVRDKGTEGELRIESRRIDPSTIEVAVSDTGVGIKTEHLTKIFELQWSTKKGAGMGFGLFWTREYVEGLGGSIEVETAWQEGTTFRVRFPISP